MTWGRFDSRILYGALLVGVFVAMIVAFPRWVVDSRLVLDVEFTQAPNGSTPSFDLKYDRGLGMKSLRLVGLAYVSPEEPERFIWEFDARALQTVQIGVRGWSGPLEVESARLADRNGDSVYEFDPEEVRFADVSVEYPLTVENPAEYHALVLPLMGEEGIARHQGFSLDSVKATVVGFILGAGVFWFSFQLCRARPFLLGWIHYFRAPYPVSDHRPRPSRRIVLPSLILLGVIVLLRSWENFLYPSLFVEDAFHYFNVYYGQRVSILEAILRDPNGYFNVLPNLVTWSFAYLDVRWLPGAYAGFAVAFSLFAATFPLATGLFRNRWMVFLVPLVLALSGLNHIFYFTTMTFQMYIVVLVLLVSLFLPAPKTRFGLALRMMVGAFFVFSGPYSVVAVPAGLILLTFYAPSKQSYFWAAMAVFGVVFMQTTTGMVRLQNLLDPAILESMARVMLDRILFFGLVEIGIVPGGVIVGVLILTIYLFLWRDAEFRRTGTVFLAIVVLAMAPLFLSQKFFQYSNPYDCHVLVSVFFWLLFLLYSVDRLVDRLGGRTLCGALLCVVLGAFVIFDQVKNPQKRYISPNREILPFMEMIHEAEGLRLEERNEFILLDGSGAPQNIFNPRVQVGSNRPDARQIAAPE
ncbi:MAG: hypothetical protein ACQKBT_04650 [Puniceicoccales bacterium]